MEAMALYTKTQGKSHWTWITYKNTRKLTLHMDYIQKHRKALTAHESHTKNTEKHALHKDIIQKHKKAHTAHG